MFQSDEKLVARTLAGDMASFRTLTERHYAGVLRLCRSILRRTEDAEDATQEVFLRAYQALGQFAERGAFGAWLHRLTVNHCLNRAQSAAAKADARTCPLDLVSDGLRAPSRFDPEEILLRAEERDRIREQLDSLPAHQKAALGLRLLEGMSYEEIAQIMGVPINSVRSWLHRGRARLKDSLQEVVEC